MMKAGIDRIGELRRAGHLDKGVTTPAGPAITLVVSLNLERDVGRKLIAVVLPAKNRLRAAAAVQLNQKSMVKSPLPSVKSAWSGVVM
jgi:hypothetical protein